MGAAACSYDDSTLMRMPTKVNKLALRAWCLGGDAEGRRYWLFPFCGERIYVESPVRRGRALARARRRGTHDACARRACAQVFDDDVTQAAIARARNRERDGGDPAYDELVRKALGVSSKAAAAAAPAAAVAGADGGGAAAAGEGAPGAGVAAAGGGGGDASGAGAAAVGDGGGQPASDGSPARRAPEVRSAPRSAESGGCVGAAAAGGGGGGDGGGGDGDDPMNGGGAEIAGGGDGGDGGDLAAKRRRGTAVRVKRLTAEEEARVAADANSCNAAANLSVAKHAPQVSEWRVVTHQVRPLRTAPPPALPCVPHTGVRRRTYRACARPSMHEASTSAGCCSRSINAPGVSRKCHRTPPRRWLHQRRRRRLLRQWTAAMRATLAATAAVARTRRGASADRRACGRRAQCRSAVTRCGVHFHIPHGTPIGLVHSLYATAA